MADSWTIRADVSRETTREALLAHEEAQGWPADWVLVGMEVSGERPDEWFVEAHLPRKPTARDLARFRSLFAEGTAEVKVAKVAQQDWLTASQRHLEPIVAGPFRVRTPEFPPLPGTVDFAIPASQAFGTGHHATTKGCLVMLAAMKAGGVTVRNMADIGTGTGVLAFAALRLWPGALATASDIDPVCLGVVGDNARANGIAIGPARGTLTTVVAAGMDHPLLRARAPYDLLIANILAGPLVELAPAFAEAVAPRGSLLLAGLLATQERAVRRSYFRAGFRLAARRIDGDWSILWLRRRTAR